MKTQKKVEKEKIHYAPYGEYGGEKTNCNRYYTSNSSITGTTSKVTCKFCLKLTLKP